MAVLVNGHELSKAFSDKELFKKLSFGIHDGERIGLIGPNGAGKSTLLKIILGTEKADSGTLSRKQGLRVAYLPQVPELDLEKSVLDNVLEGALDPFDWESSAKAYEWLSKLDFEQAKISEATLVKNLSGGWRKKVALCREIMRDPDLLLLDEPTNHLDVESIMWLEEFLARVPFATLTITHDRLFLNRISNRIWELDRRHVGGLLSIEGDYAQFCESKEDRLSTLEKQEAVLKNTLRRETEWLRRGPAARSTKQKARIKRAGDLSDDVDDVSDLNRKQSVAISFQASGSTPKKLIEVKKISKSYGENNLFNNYTTLIQRTSRIGLLGPNGAGKSTLLKVLLGLETPDSGSVERSDNLQVAYFDQNRDALDPKSTVLKTICPQGDHVKFRGNFTHVNSYLDKFLFSKQKSMSVISELSGGEQARLLIAKLMLQDANMLVLDEPTNDLDLATLNVLEEQLKDFAGAIILVSHDRYFMDQVVESILVPADGKIEEFAGVGQWEAWQKERIKQKRSGGDKAESISPSTDAASSSAQEATKPKKKLSYKDQRDYDLIGEKIQKAEAQLQELSEKSSAPDVASNAEKLSALTKEMGEIQTEVDTLYARWSELEDMQS